MKILKNFTEIKQKVLSIYFYKYWLILSLITKSLFRNKFTSQFDLKKISQFFLIKNFQAFELRKTEILKFLNKKTDLAWRFSTFFKKTDLAWLSLI